VLPTPTPARTTGSIAGTRESTIIGIEGVLQPKPARI
jgi:hypothetical protein